MNGFLVLLFVVCVVPVIYLMAKSNVDSYFRRKEEFKQHGLEWCLAELAIATSSEYKDALRGAIEDRQRSRQIV